MNFKTVLKTHSLNNKNRFIMEIYPRIDRDIAKTIATKMEFAYLKNTKNLFPYQEFVRRFMSPYTPYKHLVLYHSLGSGKSIAMLSVSMDHYNFCKRKSIIITRGDSAENNFKLQMQKYLKVTGEAIFPKAFTFYHYIQLSNMIKQMTDDEIKEFFSNKIIIMDEIHNLKALDDCGTLDNISKGISMAVNSKFLYSTATPMVNSDGEIVSLLRLTGQFLSNDYTQKDLSRALRGIISYSEIISNKPRENVISNKTINGKEYYVSEMKKSQHKNYANEAKKDIKNVYLSLVYLSLFCLPDGTCGKDIAKECMHISSEKEVYEDYSGSIKSITYKHYKINDEFENYLESPLLGSCSAIYESLINIINNTQKKKIFIYLEYVQGSGIVVLNSILEKHGYELYSGGILRSSKKRYTYCTGINELTPNINDRIEGYNDPKNLYGEYVQILIGSKIIGESISLLNVRQFHFISLHWNKSSLNQAKGRVIREGSHDDLPENERVVDTYVHMNTLEGMQSIDEYKQVLSDNKENRIIVLENIMKECAVDKYVYDNCCTDLDTRSFVAFYARSYTSGVDIYSYLPCTIESLLIEINIQEPFIDSFVEVLRIIITQNIPILENIFLRCSPIQLYSVTDSTLPFFDFPKYIIDKTDKYVEIDIHTFRKMTLKNKIFYIEASFENENIDFLKSVSSLFIENNNKFYHVLEYKTDDTSYAASVYIPSKPQQKTRYYDHEIGHFLYIESIKDEQRIFNILRSEYTRYVKSNMEYPFYGYISIIDDKIRMKGEENSRDNRKSHRGMALNNMTLKDLRVIVESIGYSNNIDIKKTELINILELYMFEHNLYSFF